MYFLFQLSLNEGAHQLRIYHKLPGRHGYPCSESFLRDGGIKHLPCSSLLIRMVKAPTAANGEPLQVRMPNGSATTQILL